MDPIFCSLKAEGGVGTAYSTRAITIHASSGYCARGSRIEPDVIRWSCVFPIAFNSGRKRFDDFIGACDDDNFIGSVDHRCNAIAIAVDAIKLSRFSDGVDTAEVSVARKRFSMDGFQLFSC